MQTNNIEITLQNGHSFGIFSLFLSSVWGIQEKKTIVGTNGNFCVKWTKKGLTWAKQNNDSVESHEKVIRKIKKEMRIAHDVASFSDQCIWTSNG